jgi:hypothetical protein
MSALEPTLPKEDRFFDELEQALARDDDSAARMHLLEGNPIYVGAPDGAPSGVMRLYPDGRREIVQFGRKTGEFRIVTELERLPPEAHWWRRPAIDPDERERRRRAVQFARASVGLEGFTPSAEAEALAARFIDGEIDLPTFLKHPLR